MFNHDYFLLKLENAADYAGVDQNLQWTGREVEDIKKDRMRKIGDRKGERQEQ